LFKGGKDRDFAERQSAVAEGAEEAERAERAEELKRPKGLKGKKTFSQI